MSRRSVEKTTIELVRGDITSETVDAIVNAANSSLMGGGGVDGAIHRAGGPSILEECKLIRERQGMLPPGEAAITKGGKLHARHVIHTVGPIWRGGTAGEAEVLSRCYRHSLALAATHGLESVAFPSISTGAYGYPVDQAAEVALKTVRDVVKRECPLRLVRFVLFGDADLETYRRVLESLAD